MITREARKNQERMLVVALSRLLALRHGPKSRKDERKNDRLSSRLVGQHHIHSHSDNHRTDFCALIPRDFPGTLISFMHETSTGAIIVQTDLLIQCIESGALWLSLRAATTLR